MKRTLVQFEEDTYQKLRQRAFRQERSVSSLVREIVAKELEREGGRKRPTRIAQLSSVRAGCSKQGRLAPVSENHDAALSDAFEK